MKTNRVAHCALAAVALLFACKSGGDSDEKKVSKEEARAARQAEIKAAIPADSPLTKLEFGMSEAEVAALLGVPTSQSSHTTGKQWIPFNFAGDDTVRTVYYYQGIGRIEFSSGSWGQRNGVVDIEHDAAEPGHKQ